MIYSVDDTRLEQLRCACLGCIAKDGEQLFMRCDEVLSMITELQESRRGQAERITVCGGGVGQIIVNSGSGVGKSIRTGEARG